LTDALAHWDGRSGSGPDDCLLHPLRYGDSVVDVRLILTTPNGANRVYDAGSHQFISWQGNLHIIAGGGGRWRGNEDALVHETSSVRAARRTAFRAFWFGWHAQFPDTESIK
jgi:hypothetical protein